MRLGWGSGAEAGLGRLARAMKGAKIAMAIQARKAKPQTVPKFTVPKAAGQPVTSGSLTTSHVPSGLAAASIALIVFAAGAVIVLILLRRRSPSR